MNQLAIPLPPARARGMTAALDHAGEEWKHDAYTFLCAFARQHEVFTGEDVSDAHIALGRPQPPDLRAWGNLYRKAQRERVIAHLDNNGRSRRRASPCPRYRSLAYRVAA